jgi:hypothetical protein
MFLIKTTRNLASTVVRTALSPVLGGHGADRSAAAQKAAETRAANARARSASARKAAETRKAKAAERSATAKRAARTRKTRTTQRRSRIDAMVDATRED